MRKAIVFSKNFGVYFMINFPGVLVQFVQSKIPLIRFTMDILLNLNRFNNYLSYKYCFWKFAFLCEARHSQSAAYRQYYRTLKLSLCFCLYRMLLLVTQQSEVYSIIALDFSQSEIFRPAIELMYLSQILLMVYVEHLALQMSPCILFTFIACLARTSFLWKYTLFSKYKVSKYEYRDKFLPLFIRSFEISIILISCVMSAMWSHFAYRLYQYLSSHFMKRNSFEIVFYCTIFVASSFIFMFVIFWLILSTSFDVAATSIGVYFFARVYHVSRENIKTIWKNKDSTKFNSRVHKWYESTIEVMKHLVSITS